MEQSPQKTVQDVSKTMQISPAEFVQESKRKESYLAVLPEEIKIMVVQQAYPAMFEQLDFEIAKIKTSENKDRLQHDKVYNQEVITSLSLKYNIPATEVAFMLDTPISLDLMANMEKKVTYKSYFEPGKEFTDSYYGYKVLLMNIEDYLKPLLRASIPAQKEANKQIVIKYLNRFINHPHYSYIGKKDTYEYPFDQSYYQFVRDLYAIVYDRSDFTFPDFHYETRHVDQDEAVDLNKRLEIALELDKSEQWLSEWTQIFQKERFWSLFAKSLMTYMAKHDDKKVNTLVNILIANKEKIKVYLRAFLKDQPIYSVKTPTYIELLESFQNYIESTGNYALFDKLKEFLDSESVALIAQNLLIASLSKQTLTSAQLKQFISYGADVHKEIVKEKAQQFITNLTNATISLETLNLLISLGADINKPNQKNDYLLIKAIKSKQPTFVRMVLDAPGIKVDICQDGYSPIWYAQNVDMDTATRTAIIDMLKEKGATQEASCAIQ